MGAKNGPPPVSTHSPARPRGSWLAPPGRRPVAPGRRPAASWWRPVARGPWPVARVPGTGASWCRRPWPAWPAAGCLYPHTNTPAPRDVRRPGRRRITAPGSDQAPANNCTRPNNCSCSIQESRPTNNCTRRDQARYRGRRIRVNRPRAAAWFDQAGQRWGFRPGATRPARQLLHRDKPRDQAGAGAIQGKQKTRPGAGFVGPRINQAGAWCVYFRRLVRHCWRS